MANLQAKHISRHIVAFREHLDNAEIISSPISCKYEINNDSRAYGDSPIMYTNLIEAPGHIAALNLLTRKGLCVSMNCTPSELIDYLKDADGVVLGLEEVDDDVLAACPNLKIIFKYGVGLDNLDVEA